MYTEKLNEEDYRALLFFFFWLKATRDAADTLVDNLEPNNSLKLSDKKIQQDLE